MRHLLAPGARRVLDALARPATLLAFDFDGTLAPIVTDRRRARIGDDTWVLLKELAGRFPCVVISGRGWRDVAARCRGIPFAAIVGNHGLEPTPESARFRNLGAQWARSLRRALRDIPGVSIENKRYTVSVHYAAARARPRAIAAIDAAVARLEGVDASHGINVVNLVPVGAPNKADALIRLRARFRCRRSLFIGDDITDEDVFAIGDEARDVGVRVGRDRASQARYYLRDRDEVDDVLRRLLEGSTRK